MDENNIGGMGAMMPVFPPSSAEALPKQPTMEWVVSRILKLEDQIRNLDATISARLVEGNAKEK